MIEVKIIADSINPSLVRLTTWLLTYPRFIHSEFMTHRVFSRNAASSRAIPLAKMIDAIARNPALPERWGSEQKGMAPGEEIDPSAKNSAKTNALVAMSDCMDLAKVLHALGLHKSVVNRYVEPWSHITVLATATDHRNFFALRANPQADPTFQVLAYRMLALYLSSRPASLGWGEWHLPLSNSDSLAAYSVEDRLKIATAQAMRTSYSAFEDGLDHAKAFEMHDRAVANGHWSPFEHSAQAVSNEERGVFPFYPWSNFDDPSCNSGFGMSGWGQYRKMFTQERATVVNLDAILASRPAWITLPNQGEVAP